MNRDIILIAIGSLTFRHGDARLARGRYRRTIGGGAHINSKFRLMWTYMHDMTMWHNNGAIPHADCRVGDNNLHGQTIDWWGHIALRSGGVYIHGIKMWHNE